MINKYKKIVEDNSKYTMTGEMDIISNEELYHYNVQVDYNELDKKLHLIKTAIKSLENKPIVEITVGNGDFNSSEVYEQIMNELEDYALIIRPSFKPNKLAAEEMIVGDTSLGARQSLVQALNEKYKDETIGTFAIELLDSLANDDMEEANLISNNFYKISFDCRLIRSIIFNQSF